jgi:hypothetical protein
MAVKLHRPGYDHARQLVDAGRAMLGDRDAWSEHQPFAEHERWHLAIDDEASRGAWRFHLDMQGKGAKHPADGSSRSSRLGSMASWRRGS